MLITVSIIMINSHWKKFIIYYSQNILHAKSKVGGQQFTACCASYRILTLYSNNTCDMPAGLCKLMYKEKV